MRHTNSCNFFPLLFEYKANIDSYKSLKFVGVFNASAFMLLIWITIFTMKHEEEEISLNAFISNAAEAMVSGVQETLEAEEVITQSQDEF